MDDFNTPEWQALKDNYAYIGIPGARENAAAMDQYIGYMPSNPYGSYGPPNTGTPQNLGDLYLQGIGNYNPTPFTMADLVRNDLITDPSYQFRFGEGRKAIENRAAAMGKRFSGNMLKALTDYGQDYASQEYANAYNRLAGISGTAQSAANAMDASSQNYMNTVGSAYSNMGSANANAALAAGKANAGMWENLGQAANTAIGNYNQTGNIFGF